jgi:hypothetical protein
MEGFAEKESAGLGSGGCGHIFWAALLPAPCLAGASV